MADIKGSDGQRDEQEFWNTFLELRRAKIPNLDQLYAGWAADEVQKLTSGEQNRLNGPGTKS
jgi:hypothetical protein